MGTLRVFSAKNSSLWVLRFHSLFCISWSCVYTVTERLWYRTGGQFIEILCGTESDTNTWKPYMSEKKKECGRNLGITWCYSFGKSVQTAMTGNNLKSKDSHICWNFEFCSWKTYFSWMCEVKLHTRPIQKLRMLDTVVCCVPCDWSQSVGMWMEADGLRTWVGLVCFDKNWKRSLPACSGISKMVRALTSVSYPQECCLPQAVSWNALHNSCQC